MYITVKKTVSIFILAILLLITILLIVCSIRPISLPFVSHLINSELDNKFHAYYINFDQVKTRIHVSKGILEFHYHSVKALDYGNNVLGSVPKVLIEIPISSFFNEKVLIKNIELLNPKISFIRTTGGALKFDIGSTDDGSSGRILETILIYVATLPTNYKSGNDLLTTFRINTSDLTLGDEITGSLLRVPNANISLEPNPKGVTCSYDFNLYARGENLHVSGECLYKTNIEQLNLLVNLDEVRPALLTEISPQFSYLTPIEMRLSGEIKLEIDKLSSLDKAEFDLTSGKGTLELIDFYGKNLEVNALNISGRILNNFSHLEIDELKLDLENAKANAHARFSKNEQAIDLKLNAFLSGSEIADLLPRWIGYLDNENIDCINTSLPNTREVSSFIINGMYHLQQKKINALGKISCLKDNLNVNEISLFEASYFDANAESGQRFKIDGPFDSPKLTTMQ